MSQQQLRRPQDSLDGDFSSLQEHPTENTTDKAVVLPDNASLKGQTLKSAASSAAGDQGLNVAVAEIDSPRKRLVTESIAGEIAGKMSQRVSIQPMTTPATFQQGGSPCGGITIGEALEATVRTAGQKIVEWSDAAAIQAAEVRATGRTTISPGGVAAAAQSAATLNARTARDEDKRKLADILSDATSKLPADRPATRKDAEGVTGAEMRNDPFLTTHPTGVAASIAAAARINQQNNFK